MFFRLYFYKNLLYTKYNFKGIFMEKITINYPKELQNSLLDMDFAYLIEEVNFIRDKRKFIESSLRSDQIEQILKTNTLLLDNTITWEEASEQLSIPENILKKTIMIIRDSTVNEIHFINHKPFILYEKNQSEWFIKLDYAALATEAVNQFFEEYNFYE